jgi:DNA-binding GntR family transcriptional regulator
MSALPTPPSRVEQVYEAIVDDICTGRLNPGTPLRQEQLAERFSVSRQPVQQALLLLRNQGLVREFGRRGLEVAPVDRTLVSHLYELRALLDGYAARAAAERHRPEDLPRLVEIVQAGRQAYADRAFARMITADVEFHRGLVDVSGNPLLVESAAVMWRSVQRVMGEVLLQGGAPSWVWEDHVAILDAVTRGDGENAEKLAREHAHHGERLILDGLARTVDEPVAGGRSGGGGSGDGTASGDVDQRPGAPADAPRH